MALRIELVDEQTGKRVAAWGGIPTEIAQRVVRAVGVAVEHARVIAQARQTLGEVHRLIGGARAAR